MIKHIIITLTIISMIGVISAAYFSEEDVYGTVNSAVNSAKSFLGLKDTPVSYSGEAGNCVKVGAGEDALEFGACGAAGSGNPFDQSLNTTENVQFAEVNTTGWFNGLFNWTVLNNWFSFTGSVLSFNETRLNETIDLRAGVGFGDVFVNETGDTMTGDLYMKGSNITFNNTYLKDRKSGIQMYVEDGTWVVAG